jgi:uncharacterized FlaG/YvyC family protein
LAREAHVKPLDAKINETADYLQIILRSTVNGSDVQVKQAVKDTIAVLKNVTNTLEKAGPKLQRYSGIINLLIKMLKIGVEVDLDRTSNREIVATLKTVIRLIGTVLIVESASLSMKT